MALRHGSPFLNAAMVATGANMVGSFSSLARNHLKKGSRMVALGTTHHELTIPAMLNVLVGAEKVIDTSWASSLTLANGMCL